MVNVKPNREKNARPIAELHTVTFVALNKLRSSRGDSTRLSQAMNAPASTIDAARPPRIGSVVQPSCGPSMIEPTNRPRAAIARITPTVSNRPRLLPLDSGTSSGEMTATGSTIAILIQNSAGQSKCSRSSPPTTGPSAIPSPAVAAHSPTARAWCLVPLKMVEISDSVAGNPRAVTTLVRALGLDGAPLIMPLPRPSTDRREN